MNSAPISPSSVDQCDVDEVDFNRCYPWIKVIIKFSKSLNYTCSHSLISMENIRTRRNLNESCCKDCNLRLFRNSQSLVEAILRMYETNKNLVLYEKLEKQLKNACQTNSSINKESLKNIQNPNTNATCHYFKSIKNRKVI